TKRMDMFYERLADWQRLDEDGLMTTPEHWGGTRSDRHAWGGHPLFHYYITILGVRPSGFEFERVVIDPQLGRIGQASGVMARPHGPMNVDYQISDTGHLHVNIELPASLEGEFVNAGYSRPLLPGTQTFVFPPT